MRLGQGRENARAFLKEHPDVAAEIEKKVRQELGMTPPDVEEAEEAEEAEEEVLQEAGAPAS